MARISTRREIDRRKTRFRIFAGMYDFISTVIGVVVLLVAVILLVSLISWIKTEGIDSFRALLDMFEKALIK